jgi:hypothetical protein
LCAPTLLELSRTRRCSAKLCACPCAGKPAPPAFFARTHTQHVDGLPLSIRGKSLRDVNMCALGRVHAAPTGDTKGRDRDNASACAALCAAQCICVSCMHKAHSHLAGHNGPEHLTDETRPLSRSPPAALLPSTLRHQAASSGLRGMGSPYSQWQESQNDPDSDSHTRRARKTKRRGLGRRQITTTAKL